MPKICPFKSFGFIIKETAKMYIIPTSNIFSILFFNVTSTQAGRVVEVFYRSDVTFYKRER